MSEQTQLDWLMRWYQDQCDGDWEHSYGVTISTIDNPGWSLKVELEGTQADSRELPRLKHNYDHETDWWTCWTEDNEFHGAGGPRQLTALIEAFRAWISEIC